jgi:hypothetical protein
LLHKMVHPLLCRLASEHVPYCVLQGLTVPDWWLWGRPRRSRSIIPGRRSIGPAPGSLPAGFGGLRPPNSAGRDPGSGPIDFRLGAIDRLLRGLLQSHQSGKGNPIPTVLGPASRDLTHLPFSVGELTVTAVVGNDASGVSPTTLGEDTSVLELPPFPPKVQLHKLLRTCVRTYRRRFWEGSGRRGGTLTK